MASRAASSLSPAALTAPGCLPLGWRPRRAVHGNCQRRSPAAALGQGPQCAPDERSDGASTSGRCHASESRAAAAAAIAAAAALLPAGAAHASGVAAEAAPPGMLEFVLSSIEGLGPWGPAAFVALVAFTECIPLFPTQPLSLASGLLFGAQKGALCMLSGTSLAALFAFLIARGVGRPLAERIITHELSGSESEGDDAAAGPVQRKLAEVTAVIERGSFWQQAGAVLLLRMTPVVPFSASNYVLGLSPMPLAPYLAGSVVGMSFWSLFYASLGGASRSLLRRGVDPDVLLADLLDKAGEYTRELAIGGAVLGAAAALYLGAGVLRGRLAAGAGPDAGGGGSDGGGEPSGGPPDGGAVPGDLKAQLGGTLSRSAATGKQMARPLSRGADAGRGLAGDIGSELSEGATSAASKQLVGSRLQGWLARRGGEELAESRAED